MVYDQPLKTLASPHLGPSSVAEIRLFKAFMEKILMYLDRFQEEIIVMSQVYDSFQTDSPVILYENM